MPKLIKKKSLQRKNHLKLGKETFGDIPIKECFHKALKPYLDPDKSKDFYLNRLG